MSFDIPEALGNVKFQPADTELAACQWAEWRSSRRHLIKMGAMGGSAIALAGALGSAAPFTG